MPDFTAICNLRRHLAKEGKYAELAALNAVACGGSLAGERLGAASRACSHCGAQVEDAAHRYYLCPSLRLIHDEDGILAKTRWMVPKVRSGNWSHMECLWSRAILPGTCVDVSEEVDGDDRRKWVLGSPQEAASASGAVFSDGSGGEAWVPKQIRRAGAGGASVDFTFDGDKFIAHRVGLVLGEVQGRQTVPRAELSAGELVLRETSLARPALWSDARYVVTGANAGGAQQESLLMSANGDGWGAFFDVFNADEFPSVRKVKAHRSILAVFAGRLSMQEYVGNHLADAAADAAAHVLQPPAWACQHVEHWTGIAYLIARRLSFIEAARWRSISRLVPEPSLPEVAVPPSVVETANDVSARIVAMGHVLRDQGSGTRCLLCLEWRHRRFATFWETAPCECAFTPETEEDDDPTDGPCQGQKPASVVGGYKLEKPESDGTEVSGVRQVDQRSGAGDLDDSDGSLLELDEEMEVLVTSAGNEAWPDDPSAAEWGLEAPAAPDFHREAPRLDECRLITRAERDRRRRAHRVAQRAAAEAARRNEHSARSAMRHTAHGDDPTRTVLRDATYPRASGLHSTHRLRGCGGIVFCDRCGGTHTGAGGKRGLLPKPCVGRVAQGSVDRLSKLRQGLLPSGFAEWPDAAAQPKDRRAVRPVALTDVS